MKRGDLVTVAAPGYYRKRRPAVIIQADAINTAKLSPVIGQLSDQERVMLNRQLAFVVGLA